MARGRSCRIYVTKTPLEKFDWLYGLAQKETDLKGKLHLLIAAKGQALEIGDSELIVAMTGMIGEVKHKINAEIKRENRNRKDKKPLLPVFTYAGVHSMTGEEYLARY